MSILYNNRVTGCQSNCIRTMINDMMNSIKSKYLLTPDDEYEFRLILNELIANGTVHGNNNHCNKTITAKIEAVDYQTISITIEDEGTGFDHDGFFNYDNSSDANLYSEGGRGLMLIKSVCDNIRFNQSGNQIRIRKSVEKTTV